MLDKTRGNVQLMTVVDLSWFVLSDQAQSDRFSRRRQHSLEGPHRAAVA